MIRLGSFGHCSEGKCVFDQFGNLEISSGRSHVTATEQGDTTDIEPGSPFGQFRGQEIAKQREERCKHENWRDRNPCGSPNMGRLDKTDLLELVR